jgi:hypothetical protein
MPTDKPRTASMSLAEKCEQLDELWASIESDPSFQQTPDWHLEIIRERLERMKSNPHPGFTVEELFSRLASRHK